MLSMKKLSGAGGSGRSGAGKTELHPSFTFPLTHCLLDRPAHAIYFATYEEAKRRLVDPADLGQAHIATAAAGVLATVASDAFNVPFDTVKQRLQVRSI